MKYMMTLMLLFIVSCSSTIKPKEVKLGATDAITKSSSDFFSPGELLYLGNELSVLCEQGDEKKAKVLIHKGHKKNRTKAMYWNKVASCYMDLKENEKAMYYYNFALMLSKNVKEKDAINNNKALLYIRMGNVEKGYLILNELKRSSEVLVHVNRALLSKEIGHDQVSKSAFKAAKRFAPKDRNIESLSETLKRDVASVKD